jgi:hypothetical protein
MNGQQSFSDMEYANRKRKTKREKFLKIMDEVACRTNGRCARFSASARRFVKIHGSLLLGS